MERVPVKSNPQLLDRVFGEVQQQLAAALPWLTHCFGKAERLVKMQDGKRYYTPNVYVGRGEYLSVSPDSHLGNFSFFTCEDPVSVTWERGARNDASAEVSLIVWCDLRGIAAAGTDRNAEAVKREVLRVLNGGLLLRQGRFSVTRIYERAENVFRGFTLDEVDNQFLMHPYCGWRFVGTLWVEDYC